MEQITADVAEAKDNLLLAKVFQADHSNRKQGSEDVYRIDDMVMLSTANRRKECQGAVFMTAKFEVFPTLSLKTFTHFTFPLRTYQMNPLSLPPFSFILTNQDIKTDEYQWITDII